MSGSPSRRSVQNPNGGQREGVALSRVAIYARIKSGEIKARKIAGVLRIREDAVQAYLAGCK